MPDALVKLQRRGQMVIPRSLREEAGVTEGTLMKVSLVEGGQFLLTPQITLSRPPREASVTSRKRILSELAEALDDLRTDAKNKGLDKLPRREVNRAVEGARRSLTKGKQPKHSST